MKKIRYFLPLLAMVLLILWIAPFAAVAVEPLDPQREGELIIEYVYEGRPVAGIPYCLYYVAEVSAEAELTMCSPFEAYPVDLSTMTEEKFRALASTLDSYVKMDQLEPDYAGHTDDYGFAEIDGLKPGMYLLTGQRYIGEDGLYVSSPSIISIPTRLSADSEWIYSVTVLPKCTFQPHGGMGITNKKVLKVWDDFGNEASRPSSIKVILLCNGQAYDTVELNIQNGWSYTWKDLPAGEEWLVVEVVPEGYSVLIMDDGLVTKIINTNYNSPPPTEPDDDYDDDDNDDDDDDDDLAQTGMLWWPMPVLIVMGIVLIVAGVRINRGSKHEA